MERHSIETGKILENEMNIFKKLYSLEEDKTSAIIEHDGLLLDQISHDQEDLLKRIEAAESDRMKQMENYKKLRQGRDIVSLKDFADSIGGLAGSRLKNHGRNLQEIISKLASLQKTNRKLIDDNMEYYNILLTGLRGGRSLDAGYSPEGKETETIKQSVLFNQTA